ncbi:MAG: XkdX family protein [Clostridium sp.]|nr:XkdX family protein [Clostridium sp.]
MSKFEKVKGYYEQGLWDEHRVSNAVIKGWITSEEYETIVGKPYEEV